MFARFTAAQAQSLLGLLLLAVGSWGSHVLLRDNQLDRLEFTLLLVIVLGMPVLVRWSSGFFIFFALLPCLNLLRRMYLLVALPVGADPLIVVPDILFVVLVAGYFLFERNKFPSESPSEENGIKLMVFFFLSFCILQIFNPYMNSVTSGINGFRQFPLYILLVLVTPTVIKKRADAWRLLHLIAFTSALAGLYGAYQVLVGMPPWDGFWLRWSHLEHQNISGIVRAFSTFSFTSTFSHYSLAGVLAALAIGGAKRLGRWRLLGPPLMVVSLLGLALTFVRSSYLGLLLAGVLGLVLASKPEGRFGRLLGVLMVGVALVAFAPQGPGEGNIRANQEVSATQAVADRALSLSNSTQTHSFRYRVGLWTSILVQSYHHPQGFGLGVGNTSRFGGRDIFQALAYSESQVFSVLAELGWVGLLAFLLLCWLGVRYAYRLHDRSLDPDDQRLLRWCFGMQLGLFAVGISGGPVLYTLPGGPLYWVAFGLVLAMGRIQALEAKQARLQAQALPGGGA